MENNRKNEVKQFVLRIVLVALDILAFVLCVDKGLTPGSILGATYIALRMFSVDGFFMTQSAKPVAEMVTEAASDAIEKQKQLKLTEKTEVVDAEN